MPPPSTIDKLPEHIREELRDLLKDPNNRQHKIAQDINAMLEDAGIEYRIHRSQVQRFGAEFKKTREQMAEAREFAKQLTQDLGEKEGDSTFDLLSEMLSNLVFRLLRNRTESDEEEPLNTGDLMKVAISLKTLAEAKMKDLKYQADIEEKVIAAQQDRANKEIKRRGLSEDMAEMMRKVLRGE